MRITIVTHSQATWLFSPKERRSRGLRANYVNIQSWCYPQSRACPAGRDLPLHSFLEARLLPSEEMGLFWAAPWGRTGPPSGNSGKMYFGSTGGDFFFFFFFFFGCVGSSFSVRGLSLVAASGGHSSSRCAGLSLSRPLFLRSTGSRRAGSVVVAHGRSCSAACGILSDQGSNPCPLHWQADSQPLRHQGSPGGRFFFTLSLLSEGGADYTSE